MKNAVNTIARGIEAGALKAGASQYLEAIEAAKHQLADNQILLIMQKSDIGTSAKLNTKAELYTYAADVEDLISIPESNIIEAYLPNTIKTIGSGAMAGNTFMTKLTIPSSLKTIGDTAFIGAESLQEDVVLPDGLETIGAEAFAGAGARTEIAIYIPKSVTSIGEHAFADVMNIYYDGPARWPEGNTYWGALNMNDEPRY